MTSRPTQLPTNLASHGHDSSKRPLHIKGMCLPVQGPFSTGSIESQVQQLSAANFCHNRNAQVYMVQQAVQQQMQALFSTSSASQPPSHPSCSLHYPLLTMCCSCAPSGPTPGTPPVRLAHSAPKVLVCPPLLSTYLVGSCLYLPDVEACLLLVITKI